MSNSELEALSSLSDYRVRKFVLDLLEYKKQITKTLADKSDLSVEKEIQLKEALEIIEENINRIRMEGIL